jgi:hypothetical protein
MGRSVSVASGAFAVAYQEIEEPEADFFDDWAECEAEYVKSFWQSFEACDKWLGREDHALMENTFCYFGVSEYCGLASLWLVLKEDYQGHPLAEQWAKRVGPLFEKRLGTLHKIGTFSNGEAVFKRKEKV